MTNYPGRLMPSEDKYNQIQNCETLILCRFTHLGNDAWDDPGSVWKLKPSAVLIPPTNISCNYYDHTGEVECASDSEDCKIKITEGDYVHQDWRPGDSIPGEGDIIFEVKNNREKYFLLPSDIETEYRAPYGMEQYGVQPAIIFSARINYKPNPVNIIHCEIQSLLHDNQEPLSLENPGYSKNQLKKIAHAIRETICIKALREGEL